MMKNKDQYSIAVRKPDKEIEVCVKQYRSVTDKNKIFRLPFIRGIFSFADSMIIGMKTLTYSADFFLEETPEEKQKAEEKRRKKEEKRAKRDRRADKKQSISENEANQKIDEDAVGKVTEGKKKEDSDWVMIPIVLFSVAFSVALFMVLPLFVAELCVKFIPFITNSHIPVIEGVVKMVLFLSYLLLISRMEDIQRTFMYHGAEHKCINCVEHGLELNVENVRKSSRLHKRCGTSFLLIVMIISIALFMFMNFDNRLLRYAVRIACVPLIAGISYEFIRLAGRTDNKIIGALSVPGLCMQKITTKEPTDDMIEVAIAAVDAVFDWKSYLQGDIPADKDVHKEKDSDAGRQR